MQHLSVEPHPLLDLRAFVTEFPRALGEMHSPAELLQLAVDRRYRAAAK